MIKEIRELVVADSMQTAIERMLSIRELPDDISTDFTLLANQYTQHKQSSSASREEHDAKRNRVVFGMLSLLSVWEKRLAENNRHTKKYGLLAAKEHHLSRAYQILGRLQQRNPIDIFFDYLVKQKPNLFHEIVSKEPDRIAGELFVQTVRQTDFSQFESDLAPDVWQALLLERQSVNPTFVNGWLDYHHYREQYAEQVKTVIEESKDQWRKLITAGGIGVFLGGVGAAVFKDPLLKLIRDYEAGIDPEEIAEDDDDQWLVED